MRGRVRGSLAGNGIVCLLALMMMAPAVALAPSAELSPRDAQAQEDLATLSGPASSAAEADGLAWMDTLPIDRLEVVAQQRAEAARPFVFPIPDGLPGYADLAEDEQRLAWKEWTRATALAEQEPGLPFDRAPAAKEVSNETESDFGKPRALQALWSLESHGQPRDMHLADDDGGAFVVTDRGVMSQCLTITWPRTSMSTSRPDRLSSRYLRHDPMMPRGRWTSALTGRRRMRCVEPTRTLDASVTVDTCSPST